MPKGGFIGIFVYYCRIKSRTCPYKSALLQSPYCFSNVYCVWRLLFVQIRQMAARIIVRMLHR